MPCDVGAVHDRWGRLCLGAAAPAVVILLVAMAAILCQDRPANHLKSDPFDRTGDVVVGYGLPVVLVVGAAVGLAVRPSVQIRPPLLVLIACCLVMSFVGLSLTPAYSRVGPPPLHESMPWAIGVSAAILGLIGLPAVWLVYPPPDRTRPENVAVEK